MRCNDRTIIITILIVTVNEMFVILLLQLSKLLFDESSICLSVLAFSLRSFS